MAGVRVTIRTPDAFRNKKARHWRAFSGVRCAQGSTYGVITVHLPSLICDSRDLSEPRRLVALKVIGGLPKMSVGRLVVSMALMKLSVVS